MFSEELRDVSGIRGGVPSWRTKRARCVGRTWETTTMFMRDKPDTLLLNCFYNLCASVRVYVYLCLCVCTYLFVYM